MRRVAAGGQREFNKIKGKTEREAVAIGNRQTRRKLGEQRTYGDFRTKVCVLGERGSGKSLMSDIN